MKYLIINQTYPFDNNAAQSSIEFTLALSTFEQEVKLLFIGKGIFQLLKNQHPNLIDRKDFIKTFKGLSMYDISEIYVDETSIQENNISIENLIIDAQVVNSEKIAKLMASVDIVFNV